MNTTNTMHIDPYLTEKNLYDVLSFVFECNIKKQQKIKIDNISNKTLIVDYMFTLPHNKQDVIVEFNGPTHYTQSQTIIRDYSLRDYCNRSKIRLVEIPYFIQLTNYNIPQYFGQSCTPYLKNKTVTCSQNSGFLSKKIILPYDFCWLGLQRFIQDMKPTEHVQNAENNEEYEYWQTSKEIFTSLDYRSDKENLIFDIFLDTIKEDMESYKPMSLSLNLFYTLTSYPT